MGKEIIFLCIFTYALYVGEGNPLTTTTTLRPPPPRLLGSKECTWGPSYWCSNITNAKSCHAVQHCIQTVWERKTLSPDNDSVCQICIEMVQEARQQLESNETQDELKQVLEGSCKLIPLKTIANECCHLVDGYIPELIETLASQMNPQVVCSVAGLCNSARIDQLLAALPPARADADADPDLECEGCHTIVAKLRQRFLSLSRDQVLQGILRVCGRLSSFADSCTNIIITYFNDIYAHLQENLSPDEVCLMAGVCTAQFHTHVEVTPLADMGKVDVAAKDDLPCDLCEQLVRHLRDLLVANTTEAEFQMVLEGLCKQTKGFRDECLSLVDQYYPEIYQFLVSELDANAVCVMMGICKGSSSSSEELLYAPTAPLLLPHVAQAYEEKEEEEAAQPALTPEVQIVEQTGGRVLVSRPELAQLPIERMVPVSLTLAGNAQLCAFCEYFLHFVQQQITEPVNEVKIKQLVGKACERLPTAVADQCESFVNTYGDAFIALLAQEIDPSQVCPLLSLCPAAGLRDVELLMQRRRRPSDKSSCPLCLFAVTELENMVKDRRTVQSIQTALKSLCSHLPNNLAPECNDFVDTYSNELIEMLVADLSPQEVCVYLKLCKDKVSNHDHDHDMTLTNEIPDNTIEGQVKKASASSSSQQALAKDRRRSPQCVICEFIMSKIEDELKDKRNEVEEVKRIVHNICNHLPKTVANDCNNFVDKYADAIIQLLIQTMEPSEVCAMLALCQAQIEQLRLEVLDCAVCESTVAALDKLLANPKVDHSMEHVLKKACLALPTRYTSKCKAMVDAYGDSFFALLVSKLDSGAVCTKVGLCSGQVQRRVRQVLVGGERCTWGPSYWCASETNANECKALKHCQDNYWGTAAP